MSDPGEWEKFYQEMASRIVTILQDGLAPITLTEDDLPTEVDLRMVDLQLSLLTAPWSEDDEAWYET